MNNDTNEAIKQKKSRSYQLYKLKKAAVPYILILPNIIIFTMFSILPILMGVYYAFTKYNGLKDPVFIGFDNFVKLSTDANFIMAMKQTSLLILVLVPLTFSTSLFLAYLMTREFKGKGMYRVIFYWPVMVSAIVVGIMWQWMFGDSIGIVNNVRRLAGLANMKTLSDPLFARGIVVLSILWSQAGYYMVMFIGGLQSIPESVYEAATIDGANEVQKFRFVTFPMLKATNLMVFILMSMAFFKSYASVKSLTGGGPFKATTFAVQQIYETAFERSQFGYASAMSVVMMAFVVVFTFISFRASKGGEI